MDYEREGAHLVDNSKIEEMVPFSPKLLDGRTQDSKPLHSAEIGVGSSQPRHTNQGG